MNFKIKSITALFFGTRAAGLYLLVFAAAIGIATFIENDFGTSAAQKVVYRALWFEILLVLFAGTLVYNIIQFRMVRQKKWALLIFHLAMIVILAGAGITRYFGFEGMMHIGKRMNRMLSSLQRPTYSFRWKKTDRVTDLTSRFSLPVWETIILRKAT